MFANVCESPCPDRQLWCVHRAIHSTEVDALGRPIARVRTVLFGEAHWRKSSRGLKKRQQPEPNLAIDPIRPQAAYNEDIKSPLLILELRINLDKEAPSCCGQDRVRRPSPQNISFYSRRRPSYKKWAVSSRGLSTLRVGSGPAKPLHVRKFRSFRNSLQIAPRVNSAIRVHLLPVPADYTTSIRPLPPRSFYGSYSSGAIASAMIRSSSPTTCRNDPGTMTSVGARPRARVIAVYQNTPPGGDTLGVLCLFAKRPIDESEDAMLAG